MKCKTFGEVYNKNILPINIISADTKTVSIVIQNFVGLFYVSLTCVGRLF
jgi:hypothetical protein